MPRNLDQISNLPDPILQSILSLVPLKSAVKTSILSKRWRDLWQYKLSSSTSLDFGEEFAISQSLLEFTTTIDRYLNLHGDQKLDSLRILFCPLDKFAANTERWITFAATKRVQQLDLDLSQGHRDIRDGEFTDGRKPFKLPVSLLDCDSLTHLNLSRCEFCSPLDFKRLGRLCALRLSHVNIDDDMLQGILIECPLLETLSLRNCQQLQSVNISGDELRLERFAMVDCQAVNFLQVSAPNLQSLHLFGVLNFSFSSINMSSLVNAFVSSIGRLPFGDYTRLLIGLAHVKILTLCTSALMYLPMVNPHAPGNQGLEELATIPLPNLQELQLLIDVMSKENLSHVFSFFQFCPLPFLERLFIRLPMYWEDPEETSSVSMPLKKPPKVIFNYLKKIKLSNFRGFTYEMRLVKFLLEKAIILESLVIVMPPMDLDDDSSSKSKASERIGIRILHGQLSMLPKASPDASIFVRDFWEDDKSLNPTHTEVFCEHSFSSIQDAFRPSSKNLLVHTHFL